MGNLKFNNRNSIVLVVLLSFLIQAQGQNDYKLDKGGIGIGGLINIKFPTPQQVADTYNEQCHLQTIDTVGFPVMCQQFGTFVFYQGRDKITNLGLLTILKSGIDPFGLMSEDNNLKKRIAIGTGLMIAGATIIATCPPIPVDPGFHDLSAVQRLQQAQAFGYVPSAPPNFDIDVDDINNAQSCTATLDVSIDNVNKEVTNFGDFTSRDFAYTSPFGSYPSATLDIAHLSAAFVSCNAALLSLIDISAGPSLPNNFVNAPSSPDIDLSGILNGLVDTIFETIGMTEFEVIALGNFNSWKNNYRSKNPSYCTSNTCQFEHGDNRMTFFENMPTNAWGNVTPKLEYYQDVYVKEYFNPDITALPLEVHLEALEIGGVTVGAYPPRSFSGSPPANKHYTFDKSWLGIADNCTAESELSLDFTVAPFYPLGNWDIPITLTDRVGNLTTGSMRIVVEDSIPPDLLPLDAIGIPVADGTTVINFDDPGIGCVTNLCEGFPSTKYLHPPVYFDFASISPDIECYVDNVLDMNLVPCTVAQLPVNDVSLITWSIADPSGNVTEIIQEVFVREQSFNQIPTVQDVTYTIGQNSQVQIPLSGNDADYDPLNFNVINQPVNGNLDAQVEAIFQTRFTTSGMIRSASGMLDVSINGESGILLSVADEKRLYAYQGDVFSIGGEVVNRYNLTVTPSAISMTDSKYINSSQDSLYQVLRPTSTESGVWIADWIARKVYRYTYNDLSNSTIEKEIFSLPAGLQQPVGLSIETAGSNYQVMIADQQDNELWKFELSRTGSGSLNNQTYTLLSSTVVAILPFKVDALSKFNTGNNETDFGKMLIVSWSAKKLDVFDWNDLTPSSYWSWDIGVLLDDPDGPNDPGLPILMDPRDVVFVSDGSQVRIKFFDQTEMKYVEKDFNKSTLLVSCGGGSNGPNPIYCSDPERDVLRLPAMVDILAIEEFNGLIYVLDRNTIGYQHLYRFDLAGRLDAVINLYSFAPSPNAYSPISQTEYVDFTLMDNGNILLLDKGDANNVPNVSQLIVNSGVDNYSEVWAVNVNTNTSNYTIALDVNSTDIVVLMQKGFVKIPLNNTSSQIQIAAYPLANTYSDLTLSDAGEIYASNILEAPFNHVTRFHVNGAFLNFIGDDNDGSFELDFNLDSNYGKIYFDNALNKLWVTDFANIFYPDLGVSGQTHRMPRISAYAPDGTLLERLIPNGDPNDFFSFLDPGDFGSITSMSVGPGRFYVAENAPLHRLHVFDTSPFIPVTCTNLPVGEICQEIGYIPNVGFIGTEIFTYGSSDPFAASSNTATVTIHVINDTQAPVLSCPTSVQLEMNDSSGFVANLLEPDKEVNETMRNFLLSISLTENTDLPTVEATHNIPAALALGQTTVVYSATDGSNNTGTCQTMVTIVDTTAPVMDVTNDKVVEATGLTTPFADAGIVQPTATDFSGYSISSDAPTVFNLGKTVITWSAIDSQGNTSQQQQVIDVVDTIPPEFTVVQVAADIIGASITTPITYTPPQAIDLVGINDAGVVCLPKVGDFISMGPNLVRCHVSDNYGNKTSSDFIINYFDNDTNGNGIIDVLDVGNNKFSDTLNGGMTIGDINYPQNNNWQFDIYEAPTVNSGVVIGVTFTPLRSSGGDKTIASAEAHVCKNKVIMESLNNETIMFDDISVNTKDYVVVTCTISGYKVFSLLGTNDFTLSLPNSSTITAHMEFNNGLEIDGWFATAGIENRGNISIVIAGKQYVLSPNQTIDLRSSEIIFINGFE